MGVLNFSKSGATNKSNMVHFQTQTHSLAYLCFLKGVLGILRLFPRSYTRFIISSAKALLNVFPMLAAGLFSVGIIFIQEYINKSNLMKEREQVASKQEAELSRLEEKIEAEKDARIRLRESSDVVVECIKALQRKLQNETQLRESFVQSSQIEKSAQNKKIDGLISRLNLLRTDLRRGITGMNAALNPKTPDKPVESAAAGDA